MLMIENYRTGLLWNIMRRCPPVCGRLAPGRLCRGLAVELVIAARAGIYGGAANRDAIAELEQALRALRRLPADC